MNLTDKKYINYANRQNNRNLLQVRSRRRLILILVVFILSFLLIGNRMLTLSLNQAPPEETDQDIISRLSYRSNIVDRNGILLATNVSSVSLYTHPHELTDREGAARGLARIFGDKSYNAYLKILSDGRKFVWLKKKLSPIQKQAVHDLGQPGLYFGPREIRIYPNGEVASHLLGGTTFGVENVDEAELLGEAGLELAFQKYLSNPENQNKPLWLSIDFSTQVAVEEILDDGVALMDAKGGTAILMEAKTGKIVALASNPDFDPNNRPSNFAFKEPANNPIFNRAAQGIYELGSTFKIFAAAYALEKNLVSMNTKVDTRGPLWFGKYPIKDFRNYGPHLTVQEVIVKSSNIGTARIAGMVGSTNLKKFYDSLGFSDSTSIELPEARQATPMSPKRWSDLSTATASFGHGIAISPLHLTTAYASIVNGGIRVFPTLLNNPSFSRKGERVISELTSSRVRHILRQVVSNKQGTATSANVFGYEVGGKTGTAEKPDPVRGGYFDDKVISTFASAFPMSNPQYVLVVTLDEPVNSFGTEDYRTAGMTAVPIAAKMIRRIAPILGLRSSND